MDMIDRLILLIDMMDGWHIIYLYMICHIIWYNRSYMIYGYKRYDSYHYQTKIVDNLLVTAGVF